ncbi:MULTISPECIES: IclR family transcriptional regulator [Halomonadaceae]|jgi:DNA-binding IclR family transcriptional regulator|uniref:HTH-type transcriptional repressor AllR n=1 Tax=Vreelandella titanicae TaxID=664683 RepID=A0A653YV35_9GAMM|nr:MULTISPECIES: IclR family transcriptional regulator [Halomonas]UEQ03799.1 IclR family transcriptional regulator [Halomonas profundus]QKS25828.1 Transcriptional repressor IclR [Halomonas titanicae]QNU64046.1 IclR family transcriptional regulator [Halomonas titanicae]TMU23076.1 IclR family transcriptional regulator [Halomonas sp. ATBC28]CAD5261544.1 Transcriptional regulator, IclR family protein [Halomonas sp. 59]|tara:strand:- start:24 stop:806 length:783 start_codon:yes stop_codon:yes gene_type:complete
MTADDEERVPRPNVQGAAAVTKGLRLLQVIAELGVDATIRNIQARLGMPRPTVYRLLNTLEQERFVERNPLGGEYVLGRELLRLTHQSLARSSLQERARATLRAIGKQTGETVHLGVPFGCHMTFVDKVESPEAVRMASYIGMPVPMHSTSVGKAYLAALDEATREQYLAQLTLEPVTHRTCTTLEALRNELTLTRERGYAIDDQENELGIICFGQAVRGADGRVEGAISVSVPRYRLPDDGHQRILECIHSLCSDAGLV